MPKAIEWGSPVPTRGLGTLIPRYPGSCVSLSVAVGFLVFKVLQNSSFFHQGCNPLASTLQSCHFFRGTGLCFCNLVINKFKKNRPRLRVGNLSGPITVNLIYFTGRVSRSSTRDLLVTSCFAYWPLKCWRQELGCGPAPRYHLWLKLEMMSWMP